MHLKLLPVHSKTIHLDDIPAEIRALLPAGWKLSQHQLETYKALLDPTIDVVINTAMTGDGKSLAAQLHTLINGSRMIAMYPTNELLVDQACNLQSTLERWNTSISREQLFGKHLDDLTNANDSTRSEELIRIFQHKVVLTNPDIWHLALQFVYRSGGAAPTLILNEMRDRFVHFVFDEFHLYNQPQIGAVLSGLLLMLATKSYPLKTLLLSATPTELFTQAFQKLEKQDRVKVITGNYRYGVNPDPQQWRTILQPVELVAHPAIPRDQGGIEEWMRTTGLQTLLDFCQAQPVVKGAIIVNSVASAKRIADFMREPLRAIGKTLETCTGLDSQKIRERARKADILIGTATVDVGVDFQINFLVFEASDAGNFIQRLGRIGRHTHYVDDQKIPHAFAAFEAHAVVPNFIYQRLFVGNTQEPAYFQAESSAIERPTLTQAVQQAFPNQQTFDRYLAKWGRFQPAKVLSVLNDKSIRASFTDSRQILREQYTKVFKAAIGKTANEMLDAKSPYTQLVREACSFRGGSPFQCGVINAMNSDQDIISSAISYDLLWLLANTECEWISEADFRNAVADSTPFFRGHHIGFMRIRAMLPQRRSLRINLDVATCDWQLPKTAQAINGIRIIADGVDGINRINREIIKQTIPVWFCEGVQPEAVRQKAYLPGHFALYRFDHDNNEGTIAFGRDALLLDSLEAKLKDLGVTPTAFYS